MNAAAALGLPARFETDGRLRPARPDLAARHLEGRVEAARFAEPAARTVCVPIAPLSAAAEAEAPLATQLLFGERFEAYEEAGLWAWGQAGDGYVGFVPQACLDSAKEMPTVTHRVCVVSAPVMAAPAVKCRPGAALPYAARVAVALAGDGADEGFVQLAAGGFVSARHLAPLDAPAEDWVGEAERFLGAPYLWGGRSALGLDCSALVQLALEAAGSACPRDSDMQEAALGRSLEPGEPLRRGDLVFWKGHVGLMRDSRRLLHANIHHMAVAIEPLSQARNRIAKLGGGPVTRIARLGDA